MSPLARSWRWTKEHVVLALGLVVLVYMFVPIAVVVLMSFNDPGKSKSVYTFRHFTVHNWTHPCQPAGMCHAVGVSIGIGLLATLVATIIGTMAAFGLVRHSFSGRSIANTIIFLPMASPEIVMGSSLLALFIVTKHPALGFKTIFIAHVMFCLSFVVVTVKARLTGLDDNLEQAAMDLYANERQTFWRITFPLVLPGILGAALLAFSLSFDDYIITNLNAGQTTTFPMFVYGAAQRGVPMQVNVVGTVMFVVAITIVLVGELNNRRKVRALAR
jgi:spermidine/putrescine transport system permease protein